MLPEAPEEGLALRVLAAQGRQARALPARTGRPVGAAEAEKAEPEVRLEQPPEVMVAVALPIQLQDRQSLMLLAVAGALTVLVSKAAPVGPPMSEAMVVTASPMEV